MEKLQKYGTLALRNSGYVLPNTPANQERFEWLATVIRSFTGEASVLQVQAIDDLPSDVLKEQFRAERKLKVAERVKARCERHPRYNPERDGRGGIKGGCSTCFSLFDLHQARLTLDAAHREFLRRATPWSHVRQPRNRTNSHRQKDPPFGSQPL